MLFVLDQQNFFDSYTQEFGAPSLTARAGLETLLSAIGLDSNNWASVEQLAYGLATFKWETANTFQPIYERGPIPYFNKYEPGTKLGIDLGNTQPGDGYLFRGRGYVQLTGRANYTRDGGLLGIDLVGNPDLALQPEVAYKIASRGMRDGWFTGHKLSRHIPLDGPSDFVSARRIINGQDHAADIAGIARKFVVVLGTARTPTADAATA